MLFPTVDFALFFFVIFVASWLLRSAQSMRKHLLLVASYFFYGYWDWRFCFLLLFNAVVSYIAGLLIEKSDNEHRRKQILILTLIIDLALLGYFKYEGQ